MGRRVWAAAKFSNCGKKLSQVVGQRQQPNTIYPRSCLPSCFFITARRVPAATRPRSRFFCLHVCEAPERNRRRSVSFPPLFCLTTLTNLRPFFQRFICCCSRPPVYKSSLYLEEPIVSHHHSPPPNPPSRESDPNSQPCSSPVSSGEQTGMEEEEEEERQTRDERMTWQPWMGPIPLPPPPPTLPGLRAKKKKTGQRREPADS